MKKLLFLLIALLSTAGAWAETYTITYDHASGTFYRNGSATTTDWSSKWVSNEAGKPVVTFSTSVNNMNAANGRIAPQTYTITVEDGYIVTGFSMNCPTFSGTITVTPNGESATEVATGEKIVVNSSASSFVFSSSASGARIQASASDGGSFLIYVEDDPNYVDWTPSISNEAFVTVGEKVASISPVTEASDNSKWYIVTQVRDGESPMYNVGTGSQLKRTATSITPATINGTQATASLQYLVRFIEVGTGLYNMQFANGEFITSSLTTSGSQNEAGTYAFYNSNGGSGSYFGWNLNSNTGSRVDNNGAGYTVAFWNSGTVSGTSGNNVWYVYSTEVAVPSTTYTYQISDESGVVFTSDPYSATAGDVISTIPANLQLPYCSYNVTSTTIVNGENLVPVTVSYNLPFTASSDFENATWYYATLRGKFLRADDSAKDGSGRYATNSTNEKTDAYKWAFFGNPYAGIYVMNKNQGDGKYLYKETQLVFKSGITPTADNNALFAASPNNNGGFSLRNIGGGAAWYVNDAGGGGNLGFWNSASGANDAGSNWVVTEVPADPIDVTYELWVGGEKVNTVVDEQVAQNSAIAVPAALTSGYSTFAYNFATEGTIGTENCTIAVTATLKDGIVLPAALSNSKSYTLVSKRGALSTYTNAGTTYLASPVKTALGIEGKKFAIITYEDNKYLYSVSDEKFVTYTSAELAPLAATVTGTSDAISFSQTTSAVYEIRFDNNASKIINSSASYTYGIVINNWGATSSQWDDGCQYVIYEAEDFDATAALAALEGFFHPANCYDRVEEEVLPYLVDGMGNPSPTIGKPFGLSAEAAAAIVQTYMTQLNNQQFSLEEYEAIVAAKDAGIIAYPADGFYFVKNASTNKYLRAKSLGDRNGVVADVVDPTVVPAAVIEVRTVENKQYMLSNNAWLNWVYPASGYEAMASDAKDKYVHWLAGAPGQGAFSIALGNGEGNYASYLATGYYTAQGDENGTILGGDGSSDAAQWIFEPATSIDVAISAAGYATLYVPFAVTVPGGVTAWTGQIGGNDVMDWLTMTEVTGTIPAATPVVLKGEANTYTFDITTGGNPVADNDLQGTYFSTEATGKYILAKPEGEGVGFYKAVSGNIAANKAYLNIASEVKGFTFSFGDEATGINAVNGEGFMVNGPVYNLAGQRIQKMQKGINIVNGKKILF